MGNAVGVKGEAVARQKGHLVGSQSFSIDRVFKRLFQLPQGSRCISKSGDIKEAASYMVDLFKSEHGRSSQGLSLGLKEHPFDFDMVARFQTANPYQGRCIHAKVGATVGLGFETPADRRRKDAKRQGLPEPATTPEEDIARIDTILDPVTRHSWQDLCNDLVEDYWQTGNALIEVVRASGAGSPIVGLFHIPAREGFVVLTDKRYNFHWEIRSNDDAGGNRLFARFGDLDGFLARAQGPDSAGELALGVGSNFTFPGQTARLELDSDGTPFTSEVIHIRRPTSLSRWYGFPDWLSAVPPIELAQCLLQHNYDFFLNRGVPEFILFLLGGRLDSSTQGKIDKVLQKTTGLGNSHKSAVVALPGGMEAQLEKLALDSQGDAAMFANMSDNLALQIVSAHGTPALLAGIQIPGKMGAANELVQAMIAFHVLVIAPAQRLIKRTLMNTLGREDSGLGLTVGDFVLNTLLDEIDLPALDTVSRQRQDPMQAAAEGRTPSDGLKD